MYHNFKHLSLNLTLDFNHFHFAQLLLKNFIGKCYITISYFQYLRNITVIQDVELLIDLLDSGYIRT